MVSWAAVESDAPVFAAQVRKVFSAGTNKTLATLRADGSPRISATELDFGSEVTLAMMPDSRKLRDVLRDPRVALHSPTLDPPIDRPGEGDAKIAGRVVQVPGERGYPGSTFRVDIDEVVWTWVENDEFLVVESWHPGRGHELLKRR